MKRRHVCCWGFWSKIISIRRGFTSAQRCIFTLVGFPAHMHTPCIQINNQRKREKKGWRGKERRGKKDQKRQDEKPLMIKSSFNPHLNFPCAKTGKKELNHFLKHIGVKPLIKTIFLWPHKVFYKQFFLITFNHFLHPWIFLIITIMGR